MHPEGLIQQRPRLKAIPRLTSPDTSTSLHVTCSQTGDSGLPSWPGLGRRQPMTITSGASDSVTFARNGQLRRTIAK